MKIKVYNQKGEAVAEHDLSPKVFDIEVNESLVHQAVVAQMANQRQVIAHTKDRSEVRGGGKKPWRQKGTGRARAGSSRSPIWIGGGITFGPRKDRNYKKDMPIKMKKKALLMTLSDKSNSKAIAIVDKLTFSEPKTKLGSDFINAMSKIMPVSNDKDKKTLKRSALLLLSEKDDNVSRAVRNLVGVEVKRLQNINIVDLLKYQQLIMTLDGVKKLEKQYAA